MGKEEKRVVKDFSRGIKIFGVTIIYGFLFLYIIAGLEGPMYGVISIFLFIIIISIIGFVVNYVPVKIINGTVLIPASDQIRTFIDFITVNPITGLYRRRSYRTSEIENVANGYTKVKRGKGREWNVVITGMKDGKSFSQRIDCSNKQVRDEVRNALKHTIKGRVNGDFAI